MSSSAPYATTSTSGQEHYGHVGGSAPSWRDSNHLDARARVQTQYPKSELGVGLDKFFAAPAPPDRTLAKRVEQSPHTGFIAEPAVAGQARGSYYARRTTQGEDPTAYRRVLKAVQEPQQVDKPQGKRQIAEPYGPPPRMQGVGPAPDSVRNHQSGHVPEPAMPRLARPLNACGLRESDQELIYDKALGRKVRVDLDTYRGLGRAGDMNASRTGPEPRPEDDPEFFRQLKDTPTFLKFCATLPPKPAVSPHERRAASERRRYEAEVDRERQLVASLQLPAGDGADD